MQQVPTGPRVAQNEESLLALAATAIYLSCSIASPASLLACPFLLQLLPSFLCWLLRLGIVNVDPIWAAAHKKAGYEINAALWQATLLSLPLLLPLPLHCSFSCSFFFPFPSLHACRLETEEQAKHSEFNWQLMLLWSSGQLPFPLSPALPLFLSLALSPSLSGCGLSHAETASVMSSCFFAVLILPETKSAILPALNRVVCFGKGYVSGCVQLAIDLSSFRLETQIELK